VRRPPENEQFSGIANRYRSKHDGVDQAEDGSVRTNPQRQRKNHDRSQGGRLPQHTLSEPNILKNGSKEMAAGGLVTFFLEFL
jgi:hypothetical protein